MSGKGRVNWMKWGAVGLVCMALSLASFSSANAASGKWKFWGEGQQVGMTAFGNTPIYQGKICYINTDSPDSPQTLVSSGAVFLSDGESFKGHHIPSANINWTSTPPGQMTSLEAAYFFYMEGGRIWLVSTDVGSDTAPKPVQVSSESNLTAANICEVRTLVDWYNPENSAISYQLTGKGGQCSDSVNKLVTLNMTSGTPPISANSIYPQAILFNEDYWAADALAKTLDLCSISGGALSCKATKFPTITNYNLSQVYSMDNERVIGTVNGTLGYYYYTGTYVGAYGPLYSPKDAQVIDAKLDPNGTVYFEVGGTKASAGQYTNYILSVAVPTSTQESPPPSKTLATFYTTKALNSVSSSDFNLTPDYVFFSVPNGAVSGGADDGGVAYSILKASPHTVTKLASDFVNGGAVVSYFYYEDSQGNMNMVSLAGGTVTTILRALLVGPSFGGTANWYYQFDPNGTPYMIVYTGGGLESFAYPDLLTTPTKLGGFPINLSNPTTMQFGFNMLGTAERRDTDYSKNVDVFFIDPTKHGSFWRLTNSNSGKAIGKAKIDED